MGQIIHKKLWKSQNYAVWRVYFIGVSSDLCANKIVKDIDSPDGKYKVVAFIRDCGATTSYSPQVSLLKKGEKFKNEPGNIFRGDESKFIDVSWEDENTLNVIYKCSDQDIFLQEKEKYGINIVYKRLTD